MRSYTAGMWKTCVKAMESLWVSCGQNLGVFHSHVLNQICTRITSWLFHDMYTFCVQNFAVTVGKFTSVSGQFYTQYTGPTKTTTN
jgi:hypothetical protein